MLYGEGDTLYGVPVPLLRRIAKEHRSASLKTCEQLLQHPLHEARFMALVLLSEKFQKNPNEVLNIYLRNTKFVNNWDLVDVSAPHVIGKFCLVTGNNDVILNLSDKENLLGNRIVVVATLPLIKSGQFVLTFQLFERFLHHPHPLIHKSLRLDAKRDRETEKRKGSVCEEISSGLYMLK